MWQAISVIDNKIGGICVKSVLLLSTGGTIASAPSEEGLVPKFTGAEMVKLIPQLEGLCHIDCKSILSLDSSNMQPEDWKIIVNETFKGLQEYDGVVITHGTDTMAYTSSILSYMLRNLNKPVILTGSQLPIDAPDTDGKRNILDAFRVAVYGLPGVYIVFDGKIIRGTRAVKMRTISFNAFESINFPYIGRVEKGRVIVDNPPRKIPPGPVELDDAFDPGVFLLKLIPGTNPDIFDAIIGMKYSGLVIESFGSGGLPYLRRNLIPKIESVMAAGIAVVVTTQCIFEGSDLTIYDVGLKAAKAGVIPGHDMTTEAVVTKLMWVLGHTRDLNEVRKMMLTDYCGEIYLDHEAESYVAASSDTES